MEKWKSAKSLLNTVIFALTVPEMERAWKTFVKTYRGEVFKPAIKYIQKTWMQDDIQRRFLRCYTNESRHFDQIASSRVEGAHSAIKRDLRVSTGDILKTMQSIGRTAHHAFCEAQYSLQREQCFLHRNLRQPLFKDVLGHVAAFALQTVKRSLDKYLQDRRIPAECRKYLSHSVGIPCIHEIKQLLDHNEALQRDHFHPQWWLRATDVDDYAPCLPVQEPRAAKPAGRPKGATNFVKWGALTKPPTQRNPNRSTRRNPSSFEELLAPSNAPRGRAGGLKRGRATGGKATGKGGAGPTWKSLKMSLYLTSARSSGI